MSYSTSKQQVVAYLRKQSKCMDIDKLALFTTLSISKSLHLSRSLTSQYLNELVKEEHVIKISSRPVYYFDRGELEKKFHVVFEQFDFLSVTEFFLALQKDRLSSLLSPI